MRAGRAAVPDGEQAAKTVIGRHHALLDELASDHAHRQTRSDSDSIGPANEADSVGLSRGPAVVLGNEVEAELAVGERTEATIGEVVGGTRELEATIWWPLEAKKSRNCWRISELFISWRPSRRRDSKPLILNESAVLLCRAIVFEHPRKIKTRQLAGLGKNWGTRIQRRRG